MYISMFVFFFLPSSMCLHEFLEVSDQSKCDCVPFWAYICVIWIEEKEEKWIILISYLKNITDIDFFLNFVYLKVLLKVSDFSFEMCVCKCFIFSGCTRLT